MASVEEDKENMTTDVAAIMSVKRSGMHLEARLKRSRSKSLGPGGLDALTNATFNERKVCYPASDCSPRSSSSSECSLC